MTDEPLEIVSGSGSLFRDFGHADADVRQAKALLGMQVMKFLDEEGLSTGQAEAQTGVSHSEFLRIRQARFSRFTIDRLIHTSGRLGQEVEVTISVHRRGDANVAAARGPLHPGWNFRGRYCGSAADGFMVSL